MFSGLLSCPLLAESTAPLPSWRSACFSAKLSVHVATSASHRLQTMNWGRSTAWTPVTHTPCRSAMKPGVTTLHSTADVPGSPAPRAIAARAATAAAPSSPSSTAPGARGAAAMPAAGTDACDRSLPDAVRASARPTHSRAPGWQACDLPSAGGWSPRFDAAECPDLLVSRRSAGFSDGAAWWHRRWQ